MTQHINSTMPDYQRLSNAHYACICHEFIQDRCVKSDTRLDNKSTKMASTPSKPTPVTMTIMASKEIIKKIINCQQVAPP